MDSEMWEGGSEAPGLGRWLALGIVVSLLAHVALWHWASRQPVGAMSRSYFDKIVPRTFRIERAEIDPKLLEPEPAEARAQAMAPDPVRLPDERPSFEKLAGEAGSKVAAPEFARFKMGRELSAATEWASEAATAAGGAPLPVADRSLQEALLAERPAPPDLAQAFDPQKLAGNPVAPAGPSAGAATPGFSDLDELLARTGPLSAETAPILMPTDLLFDYDSADLRPEAAESLRKLAALILRNPGTRFLIEGHTDAFGSDAYNLELSARRAETVRDWLEREMGIASGRLGTRGFGKSRLIAPASGTVEEQQINRRVEIVILAAPAGE